MATTHSLKALKTLEVMGATHEGWSTPPIKWITVKMMVPTKTSCAPCYGMGKVDDEAAQAAGTRWARKACPGCEGRGHTFPLTLRDVEVGVIDWPKGTRFASRFSAGDSQCELCAKRIKNSTSWRPVMGKLPDGTPLGMWVGDECNRHILGVVQREISIEIARGEAIANRETARVWRELPKPPKAVKPPKPALPAWPSNYTREAVTAMVESLIGRPLHSLSLNVTRAQADLWICVKDDTALYAHPSYTLKLDARHGATLKTWHKAGEVKERILWKDKAVFNLDVAMGIAGPLIKNDMAT